jgi:alkylation response protein AidB-like acyl-CoA dehydrogenase
MDFSLSTEQKDIQKAAREFAQGEFDLDLVLELDRNQQFPSSIWKKACELGFIGMHFPEKYGGQGLGLLEKVLVVEEFCRWHSGMGMTLGLVDFGSEIILKFGNDGQKAKYLPPIARGECVSSLAYLEKDQGINYLSYITAATPQGNKYIINGAKSFVFNVNLPGNTIVLCKLGNNEKSDEKATFIIKNFCEQVSTSMIEGKIGMRMVPMANITFDNLEVSRECLIGNEDEGQDHLENFLSEVRVEAAAMGLGISEGAFDLALGYARQREQFGQKIGYFEAIRDKLADMATRIKMVQLLTYQVAVEFDQNGENSLMYCMAKMVSAETALEVSREALHIFGGYGYIVENQIEHFYRDASMVDLIGECGYKEKSLIANKIINKN